MKSRTSKHKTSDSHQPENDLPRISQPAQRALASVGIQRLEQLTAFREKEIRQLHGMGPKALDILHQALADRGLSFKDKKEDE